MTMFISHTNKKEDAMFWDFSGRRMHDRLELGSDDISKLQNLYKPGMKIYFGDLLS